MAFLLRLLATIIIFIILYFTAKEIVKNIVDDNVETDRRNNEILQLKEKLKEERNEHIDEVKSLNDAISKLRTELSKEKSKNCTVD